MDQSPNLTCSKFKFQISKFTTLNHQQNCSGDEVVSWSANFLSCSARLKFKLSISSLLFFDILIALYVLFSTSVITFCKSALTEANLFSADLSFTSKVSDLLLISYLISSKLGPFPVLLDMA